MTSPQTPEHSMKLCEMNFKMALKKEAEGDHERAEHFLNKAVEHEEQARKLGA